MDDNALVENFKKLSRRFFRPRVVQSFVHEIAPAATEKQLASSESRMGLTIPPLLRRIYSEVGNGGFGPGYGLIGCEGGYRDDRDETIVGAYVGRRERDPKDRSWKWPEGLVPLFSWGGAIYTCGDFLAEHCPLHEFDPFHYKGKAPMQASLRPHDEDLPRYLSRWISGEEVMLK